MIELVVVFLIKSTLFLALIWAICSWKRWSAAERHATALVALIAMPVFALGGQVVSWRVTVPESVANVFNTTSNLAVPTTSNDLLILSIGLYGLVFTALMAVTVVEWRRTFRFARDLPDYTGTLPDRAETAIANVKFGRRGTPWAYGFQRPIVVIPNDFDYWPARRRQAAFYHELCHIRRRDSMTDALTRCICNVFWFQPLVWLIRRRVQRLAEQACDDEVLRQGVDRCDYAETLVDLARRNGAPSFGLAASRHPLTARIESILDVRTRRDPMNAKKYAATILLTLLATCPVACVSINSGSEPNLAYPLPLQPLQGPTYPQQALEQGIEGEVTLEFDVLPTGTTENIRVVSESPAGIFAESAIRATSQFKYPRQSRLQKNVRHKLTFELVDDLDLGGETGRDSDDAR